MTFADSSDIILFYNSNSLMISLFNIHILIHRFVNFPTQIAESTVLQAIKQLEMETAVELTDDISEAEALLALQAKIRKNPRIKTLATSHRIPVYVTKVKIKT